jgi:hypothetical protein
VNSLLTVILVAALSADGSGEPLTAKEVRRAEASAHTVEDHLRLAEYYELRMRAAQADLAWAEEQMKVWSSMAGRTKIPNPYWSASALAGMYRTDLKKFTKLAAGHRRMAAALGSPPG